MSCFESKWGNGKVTKANLKELNAMLIEAYKLDYARLDEAQQKHVDKPSSHMTTFSLIGREGNEEGYIELDIKAGTFKFLIPENNHAVEAVENNSRVYSKLMNFINNIPTYGKVFGASTYYENEYSKNAAKEFCCSSISKNDYGAWRSNSEKKFIKRRTF